MIELLDSLIAWVNAHPHCAGIIVFLVAFSESLAVIGPSGSADAGSSPDPSRSKIRMPTGRPTAGNLPARVAFSTNPSVVSVTLGGSAQLGLGYSCGKFDPVLAVTNTLNDIAGGVDAMMNAMTAAATAAIAALPALILQRANPGLYDLFQNALLKAEATMQLATKSCEQMEAEIAQGKNPYADLITLSKGNDWKLQMGIGGNDAVTAKEAVENSNGDSGIPWVGGQAGGVGQSVLEFTGDIVKAGYNINMNRPIAAAGPVPPASGW